MLLLTEWDQREGIWMKNKKLKRNYTMKQQIFFSVIMAVAITAMILSIVNRIFLRNISMNTALQNYNEVNRLTGNYLDEIIQNTEKEINRMVYEDSFQSMLVTYEMKKESEPIEVLRDQVQQKLANSVVISDLYSGFISNVIMFDVDGNYIASMRDYNEDASINQSSWIDQAIERKGKSVWVDTHQDHNDTHLQNANVLSVVKMLYSTSLFAENKLYGKCIGYVLVNIKEQEFAKLYQNMAYGETGTLKVINSDYMILSSADKSEIGLRADDRFLSVRGKTECRTVDGKTLVLSSYFNEKSGWSLIGTVEMNELMNAGRSQGLNFAIIAVMVFLLVLFIMNYVTKRITSPLAVLQEEMKKVEQGKFDINCDIESHVVEINTLISGFNVMVQRLDKLMEDVYESGKREREMQLFVTEARLKILQNQMNPHFLYNTLDSISWMAMLSGQNSISQMVNSLGEILRASVKMDTFTIKVATELELLKKYLYIQKVRHGEKINVTMNIGENLEDCQILKFMLQPFVENAIVHGMRETGEQMKIHIHIYEKDQMLISAIEDNGRGMDRETKDRLFMEKTGSDLNAGGKNDRKHTGTGCCNVYSRLQFVYPEQFKCYAESEPGKGTRIVIAIPYILESQ